MKRENRYMIFKLKDIDQYLTEEQKKKLCSIDSDINFARQQDGRGLLNAVVVESDWPEFEPVWQTIEARVNNEEYLASQDPDKPWQSNVVIETQ